MMIGSKEDGFFCLSANFAQKVLFMAQEFEMMDDEPTPVDTLAVPDSPADTAEEEEDLAEHTMIDSGLMAEFMAAHPEDELARNGALESNQETPIAAQEAKAEAISSPFSEDEEPAEGKTSIASLGDLEAEADPTAKVTFSEPQEAEKPIHKNSAGKSGSQHKRHKAPQKSTESLTSEELASSERAETAPSFLEFNTLNSPVENAVSPFLDDLPRKEVVNRPLDQKIPTSTTKAPIASAPVEEMEDMWDNIDDQDMVEWSSRSAEHKAPEIAAEEFGADGAGAVAANDSVALPRLVCFAGELHGQVFPLNENICIIGRHDDCTIVLRDASMSRHHAIISRDDGYYVVADQNSSNGTFVNGQRIEKARLRSGDEVVFGNVAFKFLEAGDTLENNGDGPKAQEKNGSKKDLATIGTSTGHLPKHYLAVAAGIAILLASFVGIIINKLRTPVNDQIDAVQIRAIFNEGITAFRGRKWNESLSRFTTIYQLEPGSILIKRYIERIKQESEIEQRLNSIQETISQKRFTEALALLEKVPEETVYKAEIHGLKNQIENDTQKEIAKVQEVIDSDAAADALPMIESLRSILPPSFATQLDNMVAAVNQKQEEIKDREVNEARQANQQRYATARKKTDSTVTEATKLFAERKITAALRLLEANGAPNQSAQTELVSLYNKISKFDEAYQVARQEWQFKNIEPAIPALRKALSLEGKITGGKSPYATELRQWQADMLYIRGMRAYSAKNYPSAFQNFHEAVTLFPNHNQSQAKLNEISQMAEERYRKAYIMKGTDPTQCKALLNEVLRMVAAKDPLYTKARELLATLQ